jgi:hypothetical protein
LTEVRYVALPTLGFDGFGGPGPWGAGPAFCPPCHTVYGPIANVCHGAIPQFNLIPTTSVVPIPNAVYPSFGYGPPVPIDGPYPPFDGPVGYGGSPVSFYGSGYGPFGPTPAGGTGWAPGIYNSEVSFLGY